jgi:TonB family protein
MKRIYKIGTILFIALLHISSICAAKRKKHQAAVRQQVKTMAVGIKCPGVEPNQPRPEIVKLRLGDITKKALEFPRPEYPQNAKAAGIKGRVRAEVVLEITSGRPVWARTLSGNPFLQGAVYKVVCRARFPPAFVDGPPNGVSGIINYKFTGP